MSEFTLPSGRVINLKERATYGDLCDAQDAQRETGKMNAFYLSLEAALSGLAIAEIRELDIDDGRALEEETLKRSGKRSVEAEAPFESPSSSPSPMGDQPSIQSPVEE